RRCGTAVAPSRSWNTPIPGRAGSMGLCGKARRPSEFQVDWTVRLGEVVGTVARHFHAATSPVADAGVTAATRCRLATRTGAELPQGGFECDARLRLP